MAEHAEHSITDTLQSLIVAFVLAMIFRGFVTEGFVIPTGSMAPTLLGEHLAMRGAQTGVEFDVGYSSGMSRDSIPGRLSRTADPLIGRDHPGTGSTLSTARPRMGDRILVLKALYPFFDPDRFDVVVFKNPTNPNGEDGNYIKRLVGLPNESIWLVDGDVFTAPKEAGDDLDAFQVRRKPEHVQRAIWQPVFDSDHPPLEPERLLEPWREPWIGSGWVRNGLDYRIDGADATTLEWDVHRSPYLDDWTPYNMLAPNGLEQNPMMVHDVRVSVTVSPDEAGLEVGLDLQSRGHLMRLRVGNGEATIALAPLGEAIESGRTLTMAVDEAQFTAGRSANVEFWHVDQRLAIYVDGALLAEYEYDWRPTERLVNAIGIDDDPRELSEMRVPLPPQIVLQSAGTPVTMRRLRIDRDLHYRAERMPLSSPSNPPSPGFERQLSRGAPAMGTHPDSIVALGPDQFFMLGDNSPASRDSRLWGSPHPMVSAFIDSTPGVVPRELLLGKAWVVYFPSPLPLSEGGRAVIPNFGSLRFIR